RDTVWSLPARRVDDLGGITRLMPGWIDPADNPALPGEPDNAVRIEHRGVEIRIRARHRVLRKRMSLVFHPDDCVETAIGHPCRAVRSDDHPMRRRTGSERDRLDSAGLRIEEPERSRRLRGIPDSL